MHVRGDYHNIVGSDITSKQNLEYSLRHGVKHLTAEVRNLPGGGWDTHELERMKDNCDKYGVVLEAIRMKSEYINKLRKGPEREREIDIIVGNNRRNQKLRGHSELPLNASRPLPDILDALIAAVSAFGPRKTTAPFFSSASWHTLS